MFERRNIVCFFLYLILWSDTGFSRIIRVNRENNILTSVHERGVVRLKQEQENQNEHFHHQANRTTEGMLRLRNTPKRLSL